MRRLRIRNSGIDPFFFFWLAIAYRTTRTRHTQQQLKCAASTHSAGLARAGARCALDDPRGMVARTQRPCTAVCAPRARVLGCAPLARGIQGGRSGGRLRPCGEGTGVLRLELDERLRCGGRARTPCGEAGELAGRRRDRRAKLASELSRRAYRPLVSGVVPIEARLRLREVLAQQLVLLQHSQVLLLLRGEAARRRSRGHLHAPAA